MRRKDREITDPQKIDEIIMACDCCRLGFSDGKGVYIVPLNFGYEARTFYFHGAKAGRKIGLIAKTGYAGFELDTNHKVNVHEIACEHSFRFQSVIGEGAVSIVTDEAEKKAGLRLIMAHHTGKSDWEFTETECRATCVFKLEVTELACKEHL